MTSATLSVNGEFEHFTGSLAWTNAHGQMGVAVRLSRAGLCSCRAACPSRSRRSSWTVSCRRCCPCWKPVRRHAGAVHDAARGGQSGQPAGRRLRRRRPRMAAAQQGDATRRDLLERFASCPSGAGGQRQLLGRHRPARRCADAGGHRQAALRAARRSGDRGAAARCRAQGGNPFAEYQLPEAAISLKQGAGRLIRTESDWGVLMVGDGRLVEKPYGKRLWRGLPPLPARASWTRRWRSTGARARAAERRASRAGS